MAKYSAVKATVNAYIKQNGRKEITGKVLNAVLNATIDSLGKYFQFAGGASPTDDPGTPDQNVCYLAGEPGVYTNFGGITIENEEVALLFWDGEWTKQRILIGIREVNASVDNQVGTPSVDVSYSGGELVLTFHNLKGDQGDTGDPAGFGTIGADINGGVGTPGVSVETSGDNTAKNLMFHFTNLKGETGVTSVVATIDDTSGTPSCQVSLVGQQLTLAFSGLKGLKGDTGVSADYPITIYNGLDSDATDQALAAAQGKVLDGKVSQLGQEVTKLRDDVGHEVIAETIRTDLTFTLEKGGIIAVSGSVFGKNSASTDFYRSSFIPISSYIGKKLVFSQLVTTNDPNYYGAVFYSSISQTASVEPGYLGQTGSNTGIVRQEVIIPSGVTHFRFVVPSGFEDSAYCYIEEYIYEYEDGLGKRIQTLENESSAPVKRGETDFFDKTNNLVDTTKLEVGYIGTNGSVSSNTGYKTTDYIPVIPGEKYFINFGSVYAFYTSAKAFVSGTRTTTNDSGIVTVPNGSSYIRVSFTAIIADKSLVAKSETNAEWQPYGFLLQKSTTIFPNNKQVESMITKKDVSVQTELLDVGESIEETLSPRYLKWGDSFIVSAEIPNGFGSIIVGRGYKSHTGKYIEVNGTNIVLYKCSTSAVESIVETIPHNIDSFSTYIKILLFCKNDGKAQLILQTLSVSKEFELNWSFDDSGVAFVKAQNIAITNVSFEVGNKYLCKTVWVLGDSLVSPSADRWTGVLLSWGIADYCLSGLSGGKSENLFDELVRMLNFGCPKHLFWALGTNDYGHPLVFVSYLNRVIQICDENGISLTLALQPDAPNASTPIDLSIIRGYCLEKGVPCVDFYSAVTQNALTGEWYPNYQSSDNLHPSVLGAKAEASQVLKDFPQLRP